MKDAQANSESTALQIRVGAKLRLYRTLTGEKLYSVSKGTGISVSTISEMETGAVNLNMKKLETLARYYNRTLDELLAAEK